MCNVCSVYIYGRPCLLQLHHVVRGSFFFKQRVKVSTKWVERDIAHISLFLSTYLFFILNSNVHNAPVYVQTNSFFKYKPLFSNKYIQILKHGLGSKHNQQRLKNIYIYYLDLPNHFCFLFLHWFMK